MIASFEAGDFEAGYAAVDAAGRDPVGRAYHLPCLPALDEVRDSPRFASTVARIGALPLK
jgi:hypothetical protein